MMYNQGRQAGSQQDDMKSMPVINLANSILDKAIALGASDIHIEPYESYFRVRCRVDGVLEETLRAPTDVYPALSTRLKLVAGMNIAEKRLPQDGRIDHESGGKNADIRASTIPTVHGEKLELRIHDKGAANFTRGLLGLSGRQEELYEAMLAAPHGVILLTGPTGCGKSTTLCTMAMELRSPTKNIVTIEDPVEYVLDGINQVSVNAKAGMTFASGLRSILRQDPDIIVVGEVRDEETAQIALRAAITGHLVLSTLHTNDAPGTVTRLVNMGLEPYLLADSLVGIISQRLMRKVCPKCREERPADEVECGILGVAPGSGVTLSHEKGCEACGGAGYSGRVPVHEMLLVDDRIRSHIERSHSYPEEIRKAASAAGMRSIMENAAELVLKGETTIKEMMRTVYVK
ncbi:MAG: GspE/PulE family protein [Oscillospiraceae bacterium]|nr:GspE/PulE family protein [Oscillospiraceae bacterium]